MNIYSYPTDSLTACRVCLATDTKLINLHKFGLIQTFFDFAGTPISTTDGLPQHICTYCYTLLKKSSEFRKKCRNTHALLLNHLVQMQFLTTLYIQKLDRSHLAFPLEVSRVDIHSTTEIEANIDENNSIYSSSVSVEEGRKDVITVCPNVDIKQEFHEIETDINSEQNYFNETSANDFDTFNFVVKPEDEYVLTLAEESKGIIKKRKKKIKERIRKDTVLECNEERAIEFKNKYLGNTLDPDKKVFYEYIYRKYVNSTNEAKNKESNPKLDIIEDNNSNSRKTEENLFISIDDGDITEKSTNLTKNVEKLYEGTENTNKKRFYQFIIGKYRQNEIKIIKGKKITDVTRMRENKHKNKKHRSKTKEDLSNFSKTYNVEILVLSRDEQIQDMLSRKETDKYLKSKLKCTDCYRGFSAEKAFENHLAIHDPSNGPHECEICRIRFPTSERKRKHIQLRHKYKFLCKLCNQVTRNSTCAREHFKCHSGHQYVCQHCGKIFCKYGSRINHIRIFHGSARCGSCGEAFAGRAGLLAHTTKAHRELFKCVACGVQFHNRAALRRHGDTAAGGCGDHIRPCTQCGENFPSEDLMRAHMDLYHNKRKPRARGQSKASLQLPSSPKPSVRWRARRPRPRGDAPDDQSQSKKPAKKLMCEMCAADGFASEAVLRYHQRIHTGEKPHPCPHCHKRFRIRELLQKHLRTHSGERPHKCAHCPKAFKTASALYTHQVVHTKIRRHRCQLCEKMFLTSTCVKTHIRTVHMKLPAARRPETHGDMAAGDVQINY